MRQLAIKNKQMIGQRRMDGTECVEFLIEVFKQVLMWEEHIHRETERGGDSC